LREKVFELSHDSFLHNLHLGRFAPIARTCAAGDGLSRNPASDCLVRFQSGSFLSRVGTASEKLKVHTVKFNGTSLGTRALTLARACREGWFETLLHIGMTVMEWIERLPGSKHRVQQGKPLQVNALLPSIGVRLSTCRQVSEDSTAKGQVQR
jgi:hypothetical protein